ncbi:hypothetical protein BC828DRAFT_392345 [Blastocladiella britannica]|nr:hypothetical protein BC828DRAFT_392345 [Blastocladiella britannica]
MIHVTAYEGYANFGTTYANTADVTIARTNDVVPTASLSKNVYSGKLGDLISAQALVQFPSCANINVGQAAISYSWQLSDSYNNVIPLSSLSTNSLTIGSTTSSSLLFPLKNLGYGSFLLKATITYNGMTTTAASVVQVLAAPLAASLPFSYQKIKSANAFPLTVRINDADSTFTTKTYSITWMQCTTSFTQCSVLSTGSSTTFTLPANSVPAGQQVGYGALVFDSANGNRFATAYVVLEGSATSVAKVSIGCSNTAQYINPSRALVVYADSYDGDSGASASASSTYAWSMSPRSATSIALPSVVNQRSLVLPPNHIAATVGAQTVILRCTVVYNGVTTFSDFSYMVAPVPSIGTFVVTNTATSTGNNGIVANTNIAGTAMTDTFYLSCEGVSGGVAPYTYSFGFLAPDKNNVIRDKNLVFGSSTSVADGVVLPAGTTNVYCIAIDSTGLSIKSQQAVTVTRPAGQTVANVITLASSFIATIQAMMISSPDAAMQQIQFALSLLSPANLPAAPSASEATTIAQYSSQINGFLVTIATNRATQAATSGSGINAAFAAQAASALSNVDFSSAGTGGAASLQASVSSTLSLLALVFQGAMASDGGVAQSADPAIIQAGASVLDNMFASLWSGSFTLRRRAVDGANNSHLFRRQTSDATLRTTVYQMLSSATRGDGCSASGPANAVTSNQNTFNGNARRILVTSTDSGDTSRAAGSASVVSLSSLPAGCYDAQYVLWQQYRTAASSLLSGVVSVNVMPVDVNSLANSGVASGLTGVAVSYQVAGTNTLPANQIAKCVTWSGSAWTSCGNPTLANGVYTCSCTSGQDFAVSAAPSPTSTSSSSASSTATGTSTGTATPTPTAEPASSPIGAIAGGVVGGVVGVGAIGGGIFMYRKRRA